MNDQMKRKVLAFLLLISVFRINSQDTTADNWIEKSEILKKESLARDIAKADFNHLKSMAMTLGLKDEDNSDAYRNSLCKYFGIKLIQEKEKQGEKIILEKAGELKMIKFAEDDEENLHIVGRAKIILNSKDDKGKPATRTIEADSIYIDLKNKEITGVGNILFKDETLEFNGRQFYYNFQLNRGVLFGGKTRILSSGNSGLKDAFFEGEKIVQADKDDSILYNGKLTTCDETDPHYFISVSRIWISQKGEWGILNGIVYVGKTPFWYLPFYYHPRDFFLNPSFGFKSKEGWYVNTTYFVLGEKFETAGIQDSQKDQNSQNTQTTQNVTLSGIDKNRAINQNAFLTITKADLDQKLREFYVKHDFYEKNPKFKIFPNFNSVNLSLRLFADAYTNLGFYTGAFFYFKYDRTNFPLELSILSDFAYSRLLYKDTATDIYYPFIPGNSNSLKDPSQNPLKIRTSQWMKIKGDMTNSGVKFSYDTQIEYASDSNYFKDFYARKLSFTYIDLLSDALKYAIQSQKKKLSNFVFNSDTSSDSKDDINTYVSMSLEPAKYPNAYGLPVLSSLSINTNTAVNLKKTNIPAYAPTSANDYCDDPLYQRYMLNYFQAPKLETKAGGTLLDYDIFLKMPGAYNAQKKIDADPDETKSIELYSSIENIKKTDASKDSTELDYKIMVPFFSKKSKVPSKSDSNNYKFKDAVFYDDNSFYQEKGLDAVDNGVESSGLYFNIKTIETKPVVENPGIKFVSFNLAYGLSDTMTNTFRFTRDSNGEYDTLQQILTNNYDNRNYLQGFNINNNLNFTLSGYYKMFEFYDSSLWRTSPKVTISYVKSWDERRIYGDYLLRIYPGDSVKRNSEQLILNNTNQRISEFSIYYEDVVSNDFSFGNYLLKGTGLSTSMRFKLFKNNSMKEDNIYQLNYDNRNNSNYQAYDPVQLYDNRAAYEKIDYLYSRFTLNFNCFQEKDPNQLSLSLAPKVNWVLTQSDLLVLKNKILNDYSSNVVYSADIQEEARDYLCYRTNGYNLNDAIYAFYDKDHFWIGPKNFRKIFEDVTFSQVYSYKYNDMDLITMNNSLIFKLINIGSFSKGTSHLEADRIFGAFPDDNFSLSFFKSMFNYSFRLEFARASNINDPGITSDQTALDEYNIMTFTNTHTFNLALAGSLFPVKLPKGNWLSFSSTTVFKWNSNARWHNTDNPNFYYLDSQTISSSILMDIFKFSLSFKAYDYYQDNIKGYGFGLSNGKIDIGYAVTEIPIFWNFFKFNLTPMVSFEFYTNQHNYYEGTTLVTTNPSYYSNNKLSVSLMMELLIGEKTDFETKIHFEIASQNSKMYLYYTDDPITKESGVQSFFEDIGRSLNFANIDDRRKSNFKLKSIIFSVEHKLHDWNLKFQYTGLPQKSDFSGRYYWENNFSFEVVWNIQSENQLMKMFNKTKINNTYEKGEWKQPVLSLDPDQK
jgi:hypothetical protein